MPVSPTAIVFDYGKVLSQDQPAADVQAMATVLDLPLPQFTELYWRFRIEYDSGSLDPDAYWNTVAQAASRALLCLWHTMVPGTHASAPVQILRALTQRTQGHPPAQQSDRRCANG